jgi:hypothetical protein
MPVFRRRLLAIAALLLPAVIVGVGPRWSSQWEEARRRHLLDQSVARVDAASLQVCPVGRALDSLLEAAQSEIRHHPSRDSWIAICRRAELPRNRILIVSTARDEYQLCDEQLHYPLIVRPSNVTCILQEDLRTLADPQRLHTFGRFDAANTIWISSSEVAWNGNLEREHRALVSLVIALLMAGWIVPWVARRSLAAAALQTSGEFPSRVLEFLLYLAGLAAAAPIAGDLREEYVDEIEPAFGPKAARRWYRRQVFTSLKGLVSIQLRRWFG